MYRYLNRIITGACLLLITASAQSQDASNMVQAKLEQYRQAYLREKVYIHTDKNFYLAGELVWFKVYYLDASTHQPIDLSKVVYVEILDRNSRPVLQSKIPVTKSGGQGSFYLPLSLKSDQYILRAYTNWMKNAGSGVFFEKTISIVNSLKPLENSVLADSIQFATEFFPESGYLVQGIETKLAFRNTSVSDKNSVINGVIVDENNDTVTRFQSQANGIGSFNLKPLIGKQYRAIITSGDEKQYSTVLPKVYSSGYVMNITDNNDGRYKVRIQARNANATDRGEKVFLLVHTRQITRKLENGYINYESDLVFYVDKSSLGEGVSHFTLFNNDQQPVAERLVFKKPQTYHDMTVSVDKQQYLKRQPVRLTIDTKWKAEDSASYSMSIIKTGISDELDKNGMETYLWLTSELKINSADLGLAFNNSPDVEVAVDNLMLTAGWRRFRWDNLFASYKLGLPLNSIPEFRGHLIKAKVTSPDGKPGIGVDCYLSYQGTPYGLSISKTDSSGVVYFDVKNYYGTGDIIVQADPYHQNQYRVDVQTSFSEEKAITFPKYFNINSRAANISAMTDELTQKSIAMQAQNLYRPDSLRRFSAPDLSDTLAFFGKPEFSYRLDAYQRFTTMEEVLREYVSSINVAMRNGKAAMSIFDEENRNIYNDNILVLLDGVPLRDYNKIFAYDPFKVRRIEVVPRRYLIGPLIFSGIASFETYTGKFDGFDLAPGILSVDYEGLQLQREFFSPEYATAASLKSRIPDMRTTLLWKPEITTDANGKAELNFYTSDQAGKYVIILQGINKKGQPLSASGSFEVKK